MRILQKLLGPLPIATAIALLTVMSRLGQPC